MSSDRAAVATHAQNSSEPLRLEQVIDQASLEQARLFMHIATLDAAAAQIRMLVRAETPALATWLQAALAEGHMDLESAKGPWAFGGLVVAPVASYQPLDNANALYHCLLSLLPGRTQCLISSHHNPFQAARAVVPVGLAPVLEAILDRLVQQVDERGGVQALVNSSVEAEFSDCLDVLALVCVAMDASDVLHRLVNTPECSAWAREMATRFYPRSLLGEPLIESALSGPTSLASPASLDDDGPADDGGVPDGDPRARISDHAQLHLGAIAAHYGSIACMETLLRADWSPLFLAGINSRVQLETFKASARRANSAQMQDSIDRSPEEEAGAEALTQGRMSREGFEVGEAVLGGREQLQEDGLARWKGLQALEGRLNLTMAQLYRCRVIAIDPQALAWVVRHLHTGDGLGPDDRHQLTQLAVEVLQELPVWMGRTPVWSNLVLASGLWRCQPAHFIRMASFIGAIDVLEAMAAELDWADLCVEMERRGQRLARSFQVACGSLRSLPREQAQTIAMWFIEQALAARDRAPELLEALMYGAERSANANAETTASAGECLSHLLVSLKLQEPFAKLLQEGLDCARGSEAHACVLEFVQVTRSEQFMFMIRAHEANLQSCRILAELQ